MNIYDDGGKSVNQIFEQKKVAGVDRPRVKVNEVLKFGDRGISVEEARKRMLESGQAPSAVAQETAKNRTMGISDIAPQPVVEVPATETIETPVAVSVEQPTVIAETRVSNADGGNVPLPNTADNKAERVENDRFVAEIRQDRGEWVAEIRYKNGAGTEIFSARTKGDLMLKLLEGKGNATLRVRAAVRREKFGTSQFDQSVVLPEEVSIDDYNAMPEKAQKVFLSNLEVAASTLFVTHHPEFYRTSNNQEALLSFLSSRQLPVTYRNLVLAFEDLTEDGLLEVKPQEAPTVVPSLTVSQPAPRVEDSTPVTVAPVPASASAVSASVPAGGVVRKRGTTGLQPGDSSVNAEITEEPAQSRGPSEAELRKMSPIGKPVSQDLQAAYKAEIASRRRQRQF